MPSGTKYLRRSAALAVAALILQGNGAPSLKQVMLDVHNRERALVGVPPLRWDDKLASSAQRWGMHLTLVGDLVHYPDNPKDPDPEGENLWLGTRGYFTMQQMVGGWIEEKKAFQYGVFPATSKTGDLEDVGHYTQMVWRTTDRVGCAITHSVEYDFLVCRYLEGGNVLGEKPF